MNAIQSSVVFICCLMAYNVEGSCPNIVGRSSWGARSPKERTRFRSTPTYVVVHHSETPGCSNEAQCKTRVKNIQDFHLDTRNWSDVGYNFLIGGNGQIYEGRGFGIQGAHAPNYNSRSLGICLIGNYQNVNPPAAQLESLKKLIACAVESNELNSSYKIVGHRQVRSTDCPGNKLYAEVQKLPHWERNPS